MYLLDKAILSPCPAMGLSDFMNQREELQESRVVLTMIKSHVIRIIRLAIHQRSQRLGGKAIRGVCKGGRGGGGRGGGGGGGGLSF